ncbi:MAG: hypothetical protein PHE53_11965 [Thermoguttaceae bacterium]|nr:hypothetical protein [Thermoguttaceae bacterium]
MGHSPQQPYYYSQVTSIPENVPTTGNVVSNGAGTAEMVLLLRQLVISQNRTNQLLAELLQVTIAPQQQRAKELALWKSEHPELAQSCRESVDALLKIQRGYLETMTMEVQDGEETLNDSEFMFNEFLDRFGPRISYLNSMLQLFGQLSAAPAAKSQPEASHQEVPPVSKKSDETVDDTANPEN